MSAVSAVLIGVILVLVVAAGVQIGLGVGARSAVGRPAPLDRLPEPLRATLATGVHAIYVFSPSCGPCKVMAPTVDRMIDAGAPIVKLDASREPAVCGALGVMATPTTMVIRDGTIREVMLGVVRQDRLEAALA